MLNHIIKLIWSRRKKNFLLIIEIAVSFLVLFAIGSTIIYYLINYNKERGFNHNNVWELTLNWKDTDILEAKNKMLLIKKKLLTYPEIENVSLVSGNVPYTGQNWTISATNENDITTLAGSIICEESFFDIMKIPIIKGRNFNHEDQTLSNQPVIINKALADLVFQNQNPVGKLINNRKVVGVLDYYRNGNSFSESKPSVFRRINSETPSDQVINNAFFFIRVKPGTSRTFESTMMNDLHQMTIGWDNDVVWLEDALNFQDKKTQIPVIILLIISIFLILNVILGLFGLLYYTINQRKSEFGLRRALGAKTSSITNQVILETVTITTFSLIIGFALAIQVPLLGIFSINPLVFISAIICSILIIFGLVITCAFLPGKQAALIQPASALHEN